MTPSAEAFGRLDLYTVLHSLPHGVTLANTEGRIVFSNAAADKILGMSAAVEASPEDWADHYGVFLPDGQTPFPTEEYPLVRAVQGERTEDVEMLVRNPQHPAGALIAVSGQPLRDEGGELIGAAVVFRDITELRRAQRLKDELAAFIVHDLKNPLTAIIGTVDILVMEHDEDAELVEDLDTVRLAARRLNRMILNLLDTHVAEDGALEPNLADIDLADLLSDVRAAALGSVGGRQGEQRILLTAPEGRIVRVDRELIFRTLMNLVDNCLKYGPDDGRIWIDAEVTAAGGTRITVRDEGPGVPERLRERIFDKYTRVERVEGYRSKDSRGLGLRFCRVVADAHGGRIWVEDVEPTGARFFLELPPND